MPYIPTFDITQGIILECCNVFNTVNNYTEATTLPLNFPTGTLHSISLISTSGELSIVVNGVGITLIQGQTHAVEGTSFIDATYEIIASTGTFLCTTIS